MASLRGDSSNQLLETLEEWNDYLERYSAPPTGVAIPGPPPLPDLSGSLEDLNRMFAGRDRSGLGSAELVELTPGLGAYFGTPKGLLVVRAPRDERLRLHVMRQQKRLELPIEIQHQSAGPPPSLRRWSFATN